MSADLRERIAGAHAARDGTNEEIAERFSVSVTTVERFGRRAREGVGLEPGRPTGRPRTLQDQHMKWIAKTLRNDPFLTSHELSAKFRRHFRSVKVHRSTILRAMHELEFTFKKNSIRTPA